MTSHVEGKSLAYSRMKSRKKAVQHLFFISLMTATISAAEFARAATPPPAPDLTLEKTADPPATPEEIQRAHEVEITEPPPTRLRVDTSREYFYKYRQALSFHGGLTSEIRDIASPASTIGFQYRFQFPENGRSEIGADLLTSGNGLIHASRFFFLDDSRFRLFYKYGLEVRVVPSEELVTFLKLANWRVRMAAGFEWNTWQAIGIRMDLEAHVGVNEQFISALLGAAYSF